MGEVEGDWRGGRNPHLLGNQHHRSLSLGQTLEPAKSKLSSPATAHPGFDAPLHPTPCSGLSGTRVGRVGTSHPERQKRKTEEGVKVKRKGEERKGKKGGYNGKQQRERARACGEEGGRKRIDRDKER